MRLWFGHVEIINVSRLTTFIQLMWMEASEEVDFGIYMKGKAQNLLLHRNHLPYLRRRFSYKKSIEQ